MQMLVGDKTGFSGGSWTTPELQQLVVCPCVFALFLTGLGLIMPDFAKKVQATSADWGFSLEFPEASLAQAVKQAGEPTDRLVRVAGPMGMQDTPSPVGLKTSFMIPEFL